MSHDVIWGFPGKGLVSRALGTTRSREPDECIGMVKWLRAG